MSIVEQLPEEVFFPVVSRPLFRKRTTPTSVQSIFEASIVQAENYKALVRADTDELLSVVTNRYQLLLHKDACNILDRAFERVDLTPEVYKVQNKGHRLDFIINIPELEVTDGQSGIQYSFWITNGYGGVTSFGLQAGMFRLLCFNGMILGDKEINWRRRHTGSLIGDAENMIEGILTTLPQAQDHMQREIDKFQSYGFGMAPDKQHESIVSLCELPIKYKELTQSCEYDTPKTMWDSYNIVTSVLSKNCASLTRQYQLIGQTRRTLFDYMTGNIQ